MKLTKEALKQIIKEELESMAEATIVNPLPKSSRKSTLPPIGGGGYRSPTKLPKQSDMPELIGSIGDEDQGKKGMGGGKDILSALRAAAEQNPDMTLSDYLNTLEEQSGEG